MYTDRHVVIVLATLIAFLHR